MTRPEAGLEATLCAAYREQAELYARALAGCDHQQPAEHAHRSPDTWLPQLIEILGRVDAIEARLAIAKTEWHRQGRPTGAELQGCLARVSNLLQALSATIDRSVKAMEADRLKIIPQIEQIACLRRMHQAYRRTARVSQG